MMSSHDGAPAGGLWSRSMMAVMVAQFFSAFGDNALLFATLALMKTLHYPDWSQPILQMLFVGAYIVLAPFVGHFADGFPKGRVMMVANGVKLVGTLLVCFGGDPFVDYCLAGVGAAADSPAKYGILGELTTGDQLVRANGLMEGPTIAAILIGSVAGGVLADWHVAGALAICADVWISDAGQSVYSSADGGAHLPLPSAAGDDARFLRSLPSLGTGRSDPRHHYRHQFVLGCGRDAAFPAGALGPGGAGHYG